MGFHKSGLNSGLHNSDSELHIRIRMTMLHGGLETRPRFTSAQNGLAHKVGFLRSKGRAMRVLN